MCAGPPTVLTELSSRPHTSLGASGHRDRQWLRSAAPNQVTFMDIGSLFPVLLWAGFILLMFRMHSGGHSMHGMTGHSGHAPVTTEPADAPAADPHAGHRADASGAADIPAADPHAGHAASDDPEAARKHGHCG